MIAEISGGINTLTFSVDHNAPHPGSGCKAALPPYDKRLGSKHFENAAWQKSALNVEGIVDGGVYRKETLGRSGELEPLLLSDVRAPGTV